MIRLIAAAKALLRLPSEIAMYSNRMSIETQRTEALLADVRAFNANALRLIDGVEPLDASIARLERDIATVSQDLAASRLEIPLWSAGLAARGRRLSEPKDSRAEGHPPMRVETFESILTRLEALNPRLFPVWLQLFENGARSYIENPESSCSHNTHRYARLFGAYLEIYGRGRILDVGCGPHGLPSYLATRDKAMVSGIDPLASAGTPDFERARGFNEFLPWDDGSFDTVVSGTSLDHVLSLDDALAEVRRVLRPDGHYVVWLASIAGAPAFDPNAPAFAPIDDFHLFHFDRAWIEPILEKHFDFDDITVIPQVGFDHLFYCMTPKRPSAG